MRAVAYPHLTAPDGCWSPGPWRRLTESGEVPLAEHLDDWDYSVSLALASDIRIDVGQLRTACGLADDETLSLVCLWESTSTGIRRVGFAQILPPVGETEIEAILEIDGHLVGGRLLLDRQVVLTGQGRGVNPLAAQRPGSVLLAEDRAGVRSTLLEGSAARFPTEVADFSALPIGEPDALWWLDLETANLDASPLGCMRLYLNAAHPAIARALHPDERLGTEVLSVIRWDVARMLVHAALDNDDFVDGWDDFPDESLGGVLQGLVRRHWPGETAASLRARRTRDLTRFEYQLQARLRLLAEQQ
jgi:hypothetical protein